MIILLLIPFYLGARFVVDVGTLPEGPEYIYRVEIVTLKKSGGHPCTSEDVKAFEVVSTLKCRPRIPDTLQCRFEAVKMQIHEESLYEEAYETVQELWINDESFEIEFDQRGVSKLIVTKNMKPWTINMIRSIVNQLNFGADITNTQDGKRTIRERTFLGECDTEFELYHGLSFDNRWKETNFEIIPMEGIYKYPTQFFNIEKRRNISECHHSEYFFASKSEDTSVSHKVNITMNSSMSRIYIADSNFTSYTINEYLVTNKNFTLQEKIKLSLESITGAIHDIPKIRNAKMVRFMMNGPTKKEEDEEKMIRGEIRRIVKTFTKKIHENR